MIRKFSLSREVLINGPSLLGRPAYLQLTPCLDPGWYWDIGTDIIPINRKLVKLKKHRLALQYRRNTINIAEHILALRWTGLDGVVIKTSSWPPYFGGIFELWQKIDPNLLTTNQRIPWLEMAEEKSAIDGERSVSWQKPGVTPKLKIDITIDFSDFGRLTKSFQLPDQNLAQHFSARPLAINSCSNFWPALSRAAAKTGLWLHHDNLIWPTQICYTTRLSLLNELVDHRLLDLLGALAMIDHQQLPAGKIISIRGGHALDVQLINKL